MEKMMNPFKKAVRENEHMLVAIAGETGSGKTYSALLLAQGVAEIDGRKIAAIDTENGRMGHYAKEFDFDVVALTAPYTPEAYLAKILQAEENGYGVCVIDSWSHSWNGEGGLEDMQNDALVRICTDSRTGEFDARKAERMTALAWKEPKRALKRMMVRLLQRKMHIIFCLRAEQKVKFEKVKQANGYEKTEIVDAGFLPICEKHFLFEMTLSVLLSSKRPGVPQFLKLEGQHSLAFAADKPIDVEAGRLMAKWCRGESLDAPKANHIGGANKKVESGQATGQTPRQELKQPLEPKEQNVAKEPAKKEDNERPAGAGKLSGEGAFTIITSSKGDGVRTDDIDAWRNGILSHIDTSTEKKLDAFLAFNKEHINAVLEAGHGLVFRDVEKAISKRRADLARGKN